jgi:putative peptidoglycan lipid II flippase
MTHPTVASKPRPTVGRSSAVMALGTLGSRLTGAVRTVLLASFGLGALTDTYNQANTTPNMVYELVAGGVLSATLVPLLTQLLRRDTRRSRDGVNAIVSLFAVVVVVASLALAVAAPLILRIPYGDRADQQKLLLGTRLLRLFAPQVACYGFVTIATAFLNIRRRFFAPMVAPVLNNIVVIIVLLWVRRLLHASRTGVTDLEKIGHDTSTRVLLGLGTTAGVFAMALALLPALKDCDLALRWRWEPSHPAIRELVRLSTWTFGYVACNVAALFFVQRAASKGIDGDYSAYTIAFQTFFLLPHGLFAVSVATAIQPELSEAFLERRRNRFRSTLARGIRLQMTVMVPAAVGFLVLAGPIASIFRSGDMTSSEAARLAGVLRAFAVGLPFFSVYLLLMNACKAMRDTRITFVVNAAENAANICLASLFLAFGWGVRGLALAFAGAYVIGAAIAFEVVSRRLHGLRLGELADFAFRVVIASTAMAGAAYAASDFVASVVDSQAHLGAAVRVGVAATVGVTVYGAVGRMVGVSEITSVTRGVARNVGRLRR